MKFFYSNSECFAKYDAFCSHIFDYACLRRNLAYCYQRGPKLWNIPITYRYMNSIFENGWWVVAYSSSYPAVSSDGHDKPFCTKAITIIDNVKKALGDTDNQ